MIEKHRITGGILLGLLIAPAAHALSIGGTSLHSYLMQPLDAEIELRGTGGLHADDLKADIGDPADFEKLGIDLDGFPAHLKLAVENRNGRWVVHVTTREPIQQPYLQFPLRLKTGKLRLIKEVTLLLDPPRPKTRQTAQTSQRGQQASSARPAGNAPPQAGTYKVKPGDTLWPIAQSLRPRGASNYQMMMALLHANPEAFENGNVNRIRAGSRLRVPAAQDVLQIDRREARNEFWRQQRALKAGAAGSPPGTSGEAEASSRSKAPAGTSPAKETPKASAGTSESVPTAATMEPRLEVLPPPEQAEEPPPVEDREAVRREILRNEEQTRSRELEQTSIRQQIASLQVQMDQMQTLLKLKDQQIAALQSLIETRRLARQLGAAAGVSKPPGAAQPTTPESTPAATPASGSGNESGPKQSAPVTVASKGPLPGTEPPARNSEGGFPWIWLWGVLGGLLIILLAVLLKRRGREAEQQGDLPLGAYPDIPTPGYIPRSGEPAVAANEPEVRNEAPAAAPPPAPTPELAPEPTPTPTEPIASPQSDREQGTIEPLTEEELELEIPLTEEEALPELEEVLTASDNESQAQQPEREDRVAAFWDELDTSGLDDVEIPPAQTEDEDQSLEILLEMAHAYVELGDRDEAVTILKQALSTADDEDRRQQIQKALEEI